MFEKMVECWPLEKVSTFRRLSMVFWERPSDPSVYGSLEVDATACLKFLEELNRQSDQSGAKITITHILAKAFAVTLHRIPELNVLIRRNRLYQRKFVDVFLQVFVDEGGTSDLSGATIRQGHEKSLQQIAQELTAQARQIRSGEDPNLKQSKKTMRLLPPRVMKWTIRFLETLMFDWNLNPKFLKVSANTFGAVMITNVGTFGLQQSWAPLVPFSRTPILMTVGTIMDKPVVRDGSVVIRPMMPLGFTVDHRIIDGFLAGKGAKSLSEILANPKEFL